MYQKFLLITPAYNAENTISKLIESVLKQSIKPLRWIIVDDGSTDSTFDLIKQYEKKHSFIQLEQLTKDVQKHSFGAKSNALNHVISKLDLATIDFIGILDADLELPEEYFSILLNRMNNDPSLGIGGGDYQPYYDGAFHNRKQSAEWSVAGGLQMFKVQCFIDIGAKFLASPYGVEDAAMEIMARAKGWRVRTFRDLPVTHYGRVGWAAGSRFRYRLRRGISFGTLGYHPLFVIARCIHRSFESPFIIGSFVELFGFLTWSIYSGKRLLDHETIRFLRKEQIQRLLGKK